MVSADLHRSAGVRDCRQPRGDAALSMVAVRDLLCVGRGVSAAALRVRGYHRTLPARRRRGFDASVRRLVADPQPKDANTDAEPRAARRRRVQQASVDVAPVDQGRRQGAHRHARPPQAELARCAVGSAPSALRLQLCASLCNEESR
eukprot:Amastigsp_a679069_33.p2 type:complete len:147 gc:universal Amastigsp_a679069_33:544-984(+)